MIASVGRSAATYEGASGIPNVAIPMTGEAGADGSSRLTAESNFVDARGIGEVSRDLVSRSGSSFCLN